MTEALEAIAEVSSGVAIDAALGIAIGLAA